MSDNDTTSRSPGERLPSIDAVAARRVPSAGHRPLLTFYDHAGGERTELSHATFDNWVCKAANLLTEECEVGPGDRVVLALPVHWTTAVLAFAVWRIGAAVVPLAPGAPRPGGGPDWAAEAAQVRVVVEAEDTAGRLDLAPAATRMVVGAGMAGRLTGPGPQGALPFGEEVLASPDELIAPAGGRDDDALVLPGEGGQAVNLTQGNLLAAAEALAAWGLAPDSRLLVLRGLHTVDGLVHGLLGPYLAGGAAVLVARPDPARLWRTVADERATAALVGPGGLATLPAPPGAHGLRHVLCPAGAGLDTVRAAAARLGIPICVGHGLVEATCASSLVPATAGLDVQAWLARSAAPTVGVPLSGAEVVVAGPHGAPSPEGERGEIRIRGDVVTPAAGRWLATGDEGFTETGPDGLPYVFVTGRLHR